ncbi:MAG: tetratricopeptide repeat protein [Longimicrobiales bacterium]
MLPPALVRVYRFLRKAPERLRAARRAARAYAKRQWPLWLACTGIVLACLLVFRNTLHNTFALDDYYRVLDNPGVQEFWPPWRHFFEPRTMSTLDRITQYRPLLPLSLSIDYALAGNSVVVHHLGNLALQLVASLLVLFLALELLRHWSRISMTEQQRVMAAGFAALLFGVHPVSGMAVNYIAARDLLLMQVFFLAALLAYARMRRLGESNWRWTIIIGLIAASLLAKTNLVVAPLLFLAFDIALAGASLRDPRVWQRAATVSAVVFAFFLGTRVFLGFSDIAQVVAQGQALLPYAATQAQLHLFHYLPHFWWPFPIRLLPAVEPAVLNDYRTWLSLAFILSSLVLAWWLGRIPGRHAAWKSGKPVPRRAPLFAFCIVAYWILMVPESSVVPLHQAAADYRPYPSSVFLFLALCTLMVQLARTRTALWVLSGFALYTGVSSWALNRNWQSGEKLWTHSVQHGGDPVAHMNLAMSIPKRSDPRVKQHLEEALRFNPNYILAHINLCLLQVELRQSAEGLKRCEHAVKLQPDWAQSHHWLATAYRRAGRPFDAVHASEAAVRLDPDNVEYHYQAALDAQLVKDWNLSLEHATHVRARVRDFKDLRFVRGFALQMLHRHEEAVVEYRRLLATAPDHVQVNFNAGYALMTLGRCNEARPYFAKTLELRPTYIEAQHYFDRCRSNSD